MRPNTVTTVEDNIRLWCQAETEEILDVAYIWTHNGLRIRDTDLIHTRVVSSVPTVLNSLNVFI